MNKRIVFVYGTLKRGEPNHHWFAKSEGGSYNFLGLGKTVEKYPLIIATEYNIPFLLHSPGNGKRVSGSVYEVDEKVFKDLDVLEDHPNFYVRQEREVELVNHGKTVTAWIYFIMNFKPSLLTKPMYDTYSNFGPHGLRYVDRYLRGDTDDFKIKILTQA